MVEIMRQLDLLQIQPARARQLITAELRRDSLAQPLRSTVGCVEHMIHDLDDLKDSLRATYGVEGGTKRILEAIPSIQRDM